MFMAEAIMPTQQAGPTQVMSGAFGSVSFARLDSREVAIKLPKTPSQTTIVYKSTDSDETIQHRQVQCARRYVKTFYTETRVFAALHQRPSQYIVRCMGLVMGYKHDTSTGTPSTSIYDMADVEYSIGVVLQRWEGTLDTMMKAFEPQAGTQAVSPPCVFREAQMHELRLMARGGNHSGPYLYRVHMMLSVLLHAFKGLQHLHDLGWVHADLSACNVFYETCGSEQHRRRLHGCIADFGRSRLAKEVSRANVLQLVQLNIPWALCGFEFEWGSVLKLWV
jgi:serine/threonine protein kinase